MDNFNQQTDNSNQNKDGEFTQPRMVKLRDRAFSDMRYVEYLKSYGIPPAPIVKPQTPADDDFGNDLELPPCELDSKEEGKQRLTCTMGLNAIHEEDGSDDEEEKEKDKVYVSEKMPKANRGNDMPFVAPIRFRSRSENVTSCSIFKFMENHTGGQKNQGNVRSFF